MKIIYIAHCDYNQVFLGDFVFLSSVLSRVIKILTILPRRRRNIFSLSLFLVSSLHRKRRETRDRERERERREVCFNLSKSQKNPKKRRKNMRCCVCYSDETELGECEVIECASGHVTCAECFNEHVKVETAKGAGYVRFVFLRFITCGKRLEERERERKRVVLIHHQRVSPLLFFLFVRLSFKKKIFFACSHLQPSSSSSSLFARTFVSSRIN